jgi:L-seryl-tRNA(Ser) seleniumtransferase
MEIRAQAHRLLPALRHALAAWPMQVTAESALSQIGSGSLPVDRLPSHALVMTPTTKRGGGLNRLESALRSLPTPVIGRIADGSLRLDLRCLAPEAEGHFADQLKALGLAETNPKAASTATHRGHGQAEPMHDQPTPHRTRSDT